MTRIDYAREYDGAPLAEHVLRAAARHYAASEGGRGWLQPLVDDVREIEPALDYNSVRGFLERSRCRPPTVEAVGAAIAALGRPVDPAELSPDTRLARRMESRRHRDHVRQLEQELAAATRDLDVLRTLEQLAGSFASRLPDAPPLWDHGDIAEAETVETSVQVLSDWHGFEHVSADRTRGLNAYSPTIMAGRVGQLVRSHLSIVSRLRRGGYRFPELFVPVLGDMVSGTIHELERHAHGSNIVQTVYDVAWLLAQALRDLARAYPRVYVAGVAGNHGRLPDARRKQMKDPTRSWDYVIYLFLREMCRSIGNVEFWFPDAYAGQVEIRGWNFLLNHGDDVRSWMGIPWYGIERRTYRVDALEAARRNLIHYVLLAHFHSSSSVEKTGGEVFVNGSLIGGTEFSLEALGKMDVPKQLMFGVHARRGVSHRWPLVLGEVDDDVPSYTITGHADAQGAGTPSGAGAPPVWRIGTAEE